MKLQWASLLWVCSAAWEIKLSPVRKIHSSVHMLCSQWVSLIATYRLQSLNRKSSTFNSQFKFHCVYILSKEKRKKHFCFNQNPLPKNSRCDFLIHNIMKGLQTRIKIILFPGYSIIGTRTMSKVAFRESSQLACVDTVVPPRSEQNPFFLLARSVFAMLVP